MTNLVSNLSCVSLLWDFASLPLNFSSIASFIYEQASPSHISGQVHDCPSTNCIQDNFILINADALLLALVLYLQPIWYKLLKLFCCTKPAPSNKVLAHMSTGAPKLPLCLQEPLKLLIAFCANGPYALDKVSGKSGMSW